MEGMVLVDKSSRTRPYTALEILAVLGVGESFYLPCSVLNFSAALSRFFSDVSSEPQQAFPAATQASMEAMQSSIAELLWNILDLEERINTTGSA